MSYNEFLDSHSYHPSLTVDVFDGGDSAVPMVLIRGDSESLMFLSKLLQALAEDNTSVKLSIAPDGAGYAYFAGNSKYGLYILKDAG
jgi:hypothetical protein